MPGGSDGDLLAGRAVAGEGRVNGAERPIWNAPGEGEVFANERKRFSVVNEEPRQPLMRGIRLRYHQKARRVLVQPVHDSRAAHAADPRKFIAAMADQPIDERSRLMPARGVNNKPSGLIDDDEVVILEDDGEAKVLGLWRRIERRRQPQQSRLASAQQEAWIGHCGAVDRRMPLLDQALDPGARNVFSKKGTSKEAV